MPRIPWRLPRPDPAAVSIAAVFLVFWGGFNVLTLGTYNFNLATQDQAIFVQLLHSIVHHARFSETIYHTGNFLGAQHFSPVYVLLAPLAAVLSPASLVALFPLLPTLACGLVAWSAVRRGTGSRALSALVLAACLFNSLATRLVSQGLRETMIAALFLAGALHAFERERRLPFAVCCVLASLCKEDVPLVVAGFVLPALAARRRGFWLLFPPVYGAAAFAAILGLVMPCLGAVPGRGGLGFAQFGSMGASYFEVALTVIQHPGTIARAFLDGSNRAFARGFLGSLGYLVILGPEYLFAPLSQYLEIALSSGRHVAELHNWYHAPAYPFLVMAFARAVVRADRAAARFQAGIRRGGGPGLGSRAAIAGALALAILVFSARTAWRVLRAPRCFQGFTMNDEAASTAERIRLYLYSLDRWEFWRAWAGGIDRRLSIIPAGAPVSVQYPFLVDFAWRDNVTQFPDVAGARWVVVHSMLAVHPFRGLASDERRDYVDAIERLAPLGFRLVVEDGGLRIFERADEREAQGAPPAPVETCLESCWTYEAEALPAGVGNWNSPEVRCRARARFDRAASGLAARASWRGSALPIGGWRLGLDPGRYTIRFAVKLVGTPSEEGFLLRLVVLDARGGEQIASRAIDRGDLPAGEGYRALDLPVEVTGPAKRLVELRVEDPHRASFLIDFVRVRKER